MDIYRIAQRYQQRALRRSNAVLRDIAQGWDQVIDEALVALNKLEETISREPANMAALFRRERLERLIRQIEDELKDVTRLASRATSSAMDELARQGADDAARIAVDFARLPREAARQAMALTSAETPVFELFGRLAPTSAERARQKIISAVALGWSPRRTARELEQTLLIGRTRAELIARTETLRAYREGARARYRAMGVRSYVWLSARQPRTCALCWALDGRIFQSNKPFYTHPGCRCTLAPLLPGAPPPDTGEEAFARLDDETQRDILGPAKFELYKAGKLRLSDLVGERHDTRFGVVRYERPLRELAPASAPKPPTAAPKLRRETTPVSAALEPQVRSQTIARAITDVLAAIDSVHADGQLPRIPIKQVSTASAYGAFVWRDDGPVRVQISDAPARPHYRMTLAHEIGHFLDFIGIGQNSFASRQSDDPSSPYHKWRQAVEQTETVRLLRELATKSVDQIVELRDGSLHRIDRYDLEYANYLLDPSELWARSYAQYIARKSGDPAMREELAEMLRARAGLNLYALWEDEEFAPIMKEMDDLFRSLGWR
jgi:SPP1 gp7 family putative phage head morphogenesis protein